MRYQRSFSWWLSSLEVSDIFGTFFQAIGSERGEPTFSNALFNVPNKNEHAVLLNTVNLLNNRFLVVVIVEVDFVADYFFHFSFSFTVYREPLSRLSS